MTFVPVPPEGLISLSQYYLCWTLANCARFQQMVGASTPEEAMEHAYQEGLPVPVTQPDSHEDTHSKEELERLRPYAIVTPDRRAGWIQSFSNATFSHGESGRQLIYLEANVPCELTNDNAALFRKFNNDLGVIIEQLMAQRQTAGCLRIDEVSVTDGPWRSHDDLRADEGEYLFAMLSVSWGAGER